MTSSEKLTTLIEVLMLLEPKEMHDERCPAYKTSMLCTCYLIRNARIRATAVLREIEGDVMIDWNDSSKEDIYAFLKKNQVKKDDNTDLLVEDGNENNSDERVIFRQVGWQGQTGKFYTMEDPPTKLNEPGSFGPIYYQISPE